MCCVVLWFYFVFVLFLVLPISGLFIIDFSFGFLERLFKPFSHIVELHVSLFL